MYNKLAIILTAAIKGFFPLKSAELCQITLVVTLAIKLHIVLNLWPVTTAKGPFPGNP